MNITKTWIEHPNWWFNSTAKTDREVINFYGEFDKIYVRTDLDSVIKYDQLARHYFRDDIFHFTKYTSLALDYVKRLLIGDFGRFSPEEFVFILLPLRHTKNLDNIQQALCFLRQHPKYMENPSIFVRFYRASIEQLSKFHGYFMDNFAPVKNEVDWSHYNLDYYPREILTPLKDAYQEDINYLRDNRITTLCVSLSGGVDSNVLLHRFEAAARELRILCIAVHINYGNRGEENNREIQLMRDFCGLLGVKLYVRHIREIQRTKDHLRDFYEEITREIRFGVYRLLVGNEGGIVLLGHHQDDAVENVMSNMRKGRNWNNLMGMEEVYFERKVRMGRPFLSLRKVDMIDYAKKHHIPYLVDSTPKWSERGRMRDVVIPAMETFRGQCDGLVSMSREMTRLYNILERSLWMPFRGSIDFTLDVRSGKPLVRIPYNENSFDWGLSFWSGVMIDIAKYFRVAYPSRRSIENFMNAARRLKFNRNHRAIINLSKNIKLVIPYDNVNIFVYYMS